MLWKTPILTICSIITCLGSCRRSTEFLSMFSEHTHINFVELSVNFLIVSLLLEYHFSDLSFYLHQGSIECRLLTSVFYDKGKEICQKCPFPSDLKNPQTKSFFEKSFKEFLLNFPRLTSDTELSKKAFIHYGNCKYTIDTFIRINAKAGFKVIAKKKNFWTHFTVAVESVGIFYLHLDELFVTLYLSAFLIEYFVQP